MYSQIVTILSELLEGTDCFLVEGIDKKSNNYLFLVDADTGFGIDKAVSLSRKLRKRIEEGGIHEEGDFALEISSPGVSTPLKQLRQYVKNIGRLVEITFVDADTKPVIGRLEEATETNIKLSITDKKKKTITVQEIAKANIKSAVVQIEF